MNKIRNKTIAGFLSLSLMFCGGGYLVAPKIKPQTQSLPQR